MIYLILTLLLAPIGIKDTPVENDVIHTLIDVKRALPDVEMELIAGKLEFIETKIELTPEIGGNGEKQTFSIWMPSRPLNDDSYVLVSTPGIITRETIMLVRDLLKSL